MKNKDFNFNYAECIKEKNNVGETIYYNICNNETHKIKWGSDTWIGVIVAFIIVMLVITALIRFIFDY
jgi:preprotein translocase subunit SecE